MAGPLRPEFVNETRLVEGEMMKTSQKLCAGYGPEPTSIESTRQGFNPVGKSTEKSHSFYGLLLAGALTAGWSLLFFADTAAGEEGPSIADTEQFISEKMADCGRFVSVRAKLTAEHELDPDFLTKESRKISVSFDGDVMQIDGHKQTDEKTFDFGDGGLIAEGKSWQKHRSYDTEDFHKFRLSEIDTNIEIVAESNDTVFGIKSFDEFFEEFESIEEMEKSPDWTVYRWTVYRSQLDTTDYTVETTKSPYLKLECIRGEKCLVDSSYQRSRFTDDHGPPPRDEDYDRLDDLLAEWESGAELDEATKAANEAVEAGSRALIEEWSKEWAKHNLPPKGGYPTYGDGRYQYALYMCNEDTANRVTKALKHLIKKHGGKTLF